MTDKTITILAREVYGVPTAYPACPQAELFARLAGTKTLTAHALAVIKELGYAVNVKQNEFKI
jgi:hypothetical protein